MTDLDLLRRHLLGYGRVLLGYSGGVDSALLAVVGRQALGAERFLAVVGRSASYPEAQWRSAVELARRFDVPLLEVDTGELADPRYLGNPTNRCYYCKTELWTRLGEVASARGFDTIIDGTNADDLGEHRPGLRAADEHRVRSPLAELGWTKAAVREASRALGLADLGRAGGAVSLEPGGLRPRDHAAPPPPGRGRRGVPARRSASRAISASATTATGRGIEVAPERDRPASRDRWAAVGRVLRRARLRSGRARPRRLPPGGLLALAPRSPLMRLFAGVPIVDDARREIVALLGQLRESGWPVRWVHEEGLHLTAQVLRRGGARSARGRSRRPCGSPGRAPARSRFGSHELRRVSQRGAPAGALDRHRRAAGAGAAAGPAGARRRGDRLSARGNAIPAPRHARASARGASLPARTGWRSFGDAYARAPFVGGPAGPLRERADRPGARATRRGSRWSSLRDGLPRPRRSRCSAASASWLRSSSAGCTATGWCARVAGCMGRDRGALRGAAPRSLAGRARARWRGARPRSTR